MDHAANWLPTRKYSELKASLFFTERCIRHQIWAARAKVLTTNKDLLFQSKRKIKYPLELQSSCMLRFKVYSPGCSNPYQLLELKLTLTTVRHFLPGGLSLSKLRWRAQSRMAGGLKGTHQLICTFLIQSRGCLRTRRSTAKNCGTKSYWIHLQLRMKKNNQKLL